MVSRPTLLVLLLAFASGSAAALRSEPGAPSYEREVQPILARRCYACHSRQVSVPQGGLLLDSAAGWRRGGTSGPAVVPGHPEKSLLVQAVRYDQTRKMPPAGRLPEAEVALLTRWVAAGAPGGAAGAGAEDPSRWWSFQPLKRPPLPRVRQLSWCRTPIDRFVLAKLEAKGLRPSPPADRRTLIRRVTFDLTGLPPTPAEVRAFLADRSATAYEKVVDRLLASPRYGERWGRHWLDVVHYADTHGYDKDKRRDHAWPYRDYVIRALNQDKPYARFLSEQVAGDVLYPRDPDAVVATGFVAAGPWDFVGEVELAEGTVEKEKTRLLDRDDMVANAIGTFNSVTVGCARCHDHKFDPIPQRDYYRLQSVFAGVDRGDRPIPDPVLDARRSSLETERVAAIARRAELLKKAAALSSPALTRCDQALAEAKQQLAALPLPAGGPGSPSNGYHSAISTAADAEKWVQVDLGRAVPVDAVLLIPARPADFPDTPGFGFPARFRVAVSDDAAFTHARVLADRTGADFPNPGDEPVLIPAEGAAARYVRVTATRLWPRTGDFVFALAELQVISRGRNVARGAAVTALDSIEAGRWSVKYLVDNFSSRAELSGDADPAFASRVQERAELRAKVAALEAERARIADALLAPSLRQEIEVATVRLAAIEGQIHSLPEPPRVYALLTRAPRPIHVLRRGDVEQPAEEVHPGALGCLAGLNPDFGPIAAAREEPRAALAEWLASPRNPLTWRSIANRVWEYHFGRGIVDTPNDFGRNGSRPTHPELLDWLAAAFLAQPSSEIRPDRERESAKERRARKDIKADLCVSSDERRSTSDRDSFSFPSRFLSFATSRSHLPDIEHPTPNLALGGSLKALHRLIVLSAAYRQAATDNPVAARLDGDNRLLWRMNRRRLEAEEIRDSVLAVSGKLDLRMGGPGFELFRFKDDHSPVYDHGAIDKLTSPAGWRRAVYRFTVRSVPNPFLECLDCADPNVSTPVRNTTLTALQALALLNDPFMLQQAGFFADRLRSISGNPARQINAAFELAFGRPARPEERIALVAYARQRGLAAACRLLLNANEFVFVD